MLKLMNMLKLVNIASKIPKKHQAKYELVRKSVKTVFPNLDVVIKNNNVKNDSHISEIVQSWFRICEVVKNILFKNAVPNSDPVNQNKDKFQSIWNGNLFRRMEEPLFTRIIQTIQTNMDINVNLDEKYIEDQNYVKSSVDLYSARGMILNMKPFDGGYGKTGVEKAPSPVFRPNPAEKKIPTSKGKNSSAPASVFHPDPVKQSNPDPKSNDISIYVDASVIKEKIGLGMFIDDEKYSHLNRSYSVIASGSSDNNRGEILALILALRFILKWKICMNRTITIYSDSETAVEYANLIRKGKFCQKERRTLQELLDTCEARGMTVKVLWVKAHSGIHGNEMADESAKSAALKCLELEESVRKLQKRGAVTRKFARRSIHSRRG